MTLFGQGQYGGFIFVPFSVQSTHSGYEALNVSISKAVLNGMGLVLAATIGSNWDAYLAMLSAIFGISNNGHEAV